MDSVGLLANGLLPTRGSLMLDVIIIATGTILLALLVSVSLVRRRHYHWHRSIQIVLTILLTIAIVLFEIDIRIFTDWRKLAEPSPFYESGIVNWSLIVHLIFAIPTPFIWFFVIWKALRLIRWEQTDYRTEHRFWGRLAAFMMFMTTVTGWLFYWLAFAAS